MRHGVGEGGFELFVIGAEANESLDFALRQGHERGVVVALVGAASNPDEGRAHAIEGVPGGFHVGGLAVVEEADAVYFTHGLQAVGGVLESGQAGFDLGFIEAGETGAEHGGSQILPVVLADERAAADVQVLPVAAVGVAGREGGVQHVLAGIVGSQSHVGTLVPGEGQQVSRHEGSLQVADRYLVVGVVDKVTLGVQVAGDTQLGLRVLFEVVVVAVEVVGRDVEQHRHPGPEVVGVVELKRA